MNRLACASIALLAACATNGVSSDWNDRKPEPETVPVDGGTSAGEASTDGGLPEPPDAERPLVCGKTGYCETRLPLSDEASTLSLRGVWAVSSTDVWSVSAEGFVLHWDGATWTTAYRTVHELHSVWATATDVWVGGERGLLLRRTADGTWSFVETGHVEDIRGIYGSGAGDVWFGHDGAVDHYDGSTLTTYPLPVPALQFRSVFGRAGFGTYALYAEGCVYCGDSSNTSRALVFELVPGQITDFNTAVSSQWGVYPVSAVVSGEADEGRRIFMFGYTKQSSNYGWTYLYAFFGKSTTRYFPQALRTPSRQPMAITDPAEKVLPAQLPLPSWDLGGTAVRVHPAIGVGYRWDGGNFVLLPSLDMGYDFVPATLFAVHGDSVNTWLVGDGFALKGPTQ